MDTARIFLAIIQTVYNLYAPSVITNGVNLRFYGDSFEDCKTVSHPEGFKDLIGTSFYDPLKPTVVMVHGWGNASVVDVYLTKPFVDAYIARGDHNKVFVDWTFWSQTENFFDAVASMKAVATLISSMLHDMQAFEFDLSKVHLVGHSLGGQMVGMIGDHSIINYGFKFQRITTLDAAGVMFFNGGALDGKVQGMPSINKNNSIYVDCIHTDADVYGKSEGECHADFWPNKGRRYQPGCFNECNLGENCYRCGHIRAIQLYLESVTYQTPHFISNQCPDDVIYPNVNNETCQGPNTASMGFYADKPEKAFGNFYLETKSKFPFSF